MEDSLKCLLILLNIFKVITIAPTLTPVSTNMGTGHGTTFNQKTQGANRYYEFTAPMSLHAFGFSTAAVSATGTKIFDTSANLLATASQPYAVSYTLTMKNPLKIVIATDQCQLQTFDLQFSAGTYTLVQTNLNNYAGTVAGFLGTDNYRTSSLIYILEFDIASSSALNRRMARYDLNFPATLTAGPVMPSVGSGNGIYLVPTTDYMVMSGFYTNMVVIEKTGFTQVKSKTTPGQDSFSIVDNLNPSRVISNKYPSTGDIFIYDINLSNLNPIDLLYRTTFAYSHNFLMNFGPFPYVGITPQGRSEVFIFSKTDATLLYQPVMTSSGLVQYYCTTKTRQIDNRLYYMFTNKETASVYNVHAYYLQFDKCLGRDGANTCTNCVSGTYYDSTTPANQCWYPTEVPDRLGINSLSPVLSPCQDANCIRCDADYTICTVCDTGSSFYLNTTTATCLAPASFSDGFGVDTITSMIAACSITGCKTCKTDITGCTACDTVSNYWLQTSPSITCLQPGSMPAGKGPNTVNGGIKPCAVVQCTTCNLDADSCLACNTGGSFYLNSTANSCQLSASFSDGFGVSTITSMIAACSITGCKTCKTDITGCTACDTVSNYWLQTSPSITCLQPGSMPAGKGPNTVNGGIKPCAVVQCTRCSNNADVCMACNSGGGYYYYSGTNTCTDISNQPLIGPLGINSISGVWQVCSDPKCQKCQANYQTCTECDQANGYILVNGACSNPSAPPPVPGYQNNTTGSHSQALSIKTHFESPKVKVIFSRPVRFESTTEELVLATSIHLTDDSQKVIQCKQKTCHATITKDTIIIDLQLGEDVYDAQLHIIDASLRFVDSDTNLLFTEFPIVINHITLLTDEAGSLKSVAQQISHSAAPSRCIANIVLAGTNPAVSVLIDKIMSEFVYIELLNGPAMVFPDFILRHTFDKKYWPVDVSNPFLGFVGNEVCEKPENLDKSHKGCSILINYGDDAHILGYTLAINIVISLIGYGIYEWTRRKFSRFASPAGAAILDPRIPHSSNTALMAAHNLFKSKEPPIWFRSLNYIREFYGIKYFLMHAEGNALEMICFAFIHLGYALGPSAAGIVGSIFCGSLVLLHLVIAVLSSRAGRKLVSWLKRRPQSKGTARDALIYSKSKWIILDFLFDGLKPIASAFLSTRPALQYVRYSLVSLAVVAFSNFGIAQNSVVIMVEIIYFVYLLKSNVKVSKYARALELINQALFIVYNLFKMMSTIEMNESKKQASIGTTLGVVLLMLVMINVGYAIAAVIMMVYEPLRDYLKKRRQASRVSVIADNGVDNIVGHPKRISIGSLGNHVNRAARVSIEPAKRLLTSRLTGSMRSQLEKSSVSDLARPGVNPGTVRLRVEGKAKETIGIEDGLFSSRRSIAKAGVIVQKHQMQNFISDTSTQPRNLTGSLIRNSSMIRAPLKLKTAIKNISEKSINFESKPVVSSSRQVTRKLIRNSSCIIKTLPRDS